MVFCASCRHGFRWSQASPIAAPDYVEGERINLKDFADRRSVLEAVEDPVRVAIARGIADPARS